MSLCERQYGIACKVKLVFDSKVQFLPENLPNGKLVFVHVSYDAFQPFV